GDEVPAPEHQVPAPVPELPGDLLSHLLSRLPVLDLYPHGLTLRYRIQPM
ncbi:hypothetical protein A2U01_0050783, partial [Trifolium medium]|nr:hypothetical protein [Trifolium medium]